MNVITRGIRNAFRNGIRTFSIVIILGLSIGLALTMVVARQAVQAKIASVKASIGNEVTISPAGARGFEGGGNPLTDTQMATVTSLPHIVSLTETLGDRLSSTQTNLQSSITAGSLGQRNANFGGGGGGAGGFGGGGTASNATFTPPVTVTGTNSTTSTSVLVGGGTIKITSGKAFNPTVDADVALVGTDLASKNNLKVGSTFQAYSTTFTVDGIYDAGNTFSNSGLLMPLPTVQRLSQQPGDVTSATAQVDSISNVSGAVSAIEGKLGSAADVTSAQDTSNQALAPLQSISTISLISVIGAVIAGAAIILLTMLMIVRERRREIGVLKAIGSSNVKVTLQFITESITFTLLGAVVGLVLGVIGGNPVTNLLVTTTTSTTSGGGATGRFGGAGGGGGFGRAGGAFLRAGGASLHNINAVVGWDIILYGLAAAIVIAVIGSAIPAWFIAKVRPAEVMRVE
jgi:putative ABC transport system permease protein